MKYIRTSAHPFVYASKMEATVCDSGQTTMHNWASSRGNVAFTVRDHLETSSIITGATVSDEEVLSQKAYFDSPISGSNQIYQTLGYIYNI